MKAGGIRGMLVAVWAAVGACATTPPTAPPLIAPPPVQMDATALLEPPPAVGSEAAQRDLQTVLEAQRAAHTAGTTARAVGDAEINCARFVDAMNPQSRAAAVTVDGAAALAWVTRAAQQVSAATRAPKRHWQRPRPFIVSSEVERLGDVAADNPLPADLAFERDHTSYPSGHAAFGMACAIVLAQMLPEQGAALFARGRSYGDSRVIVGAHFPSDVEAGRVVGAAAAAIMLKNEQFQRDLAKARVALTFRGARDR